MLKDWILQQLGPYHPLLPPWRKVVNADVVPGKWVCALQDKILGTKVEPEINLGKTTVLGGICSLFTFELEEARKYASDLGSFKQWMLSWYPRLDQVHDTVGIPPNTVKEIIYVCEDSLFARRVSSNTNWISDVIRDVHELCGQSVLERWVRQDGYRGPIRVVYTSDYEREMDVALRIWERAIGCRFSKKYQDALKVKMMYTNLWLDILEIDGSSVVFEPANHMSHGGFRELDGWYKQQTGVQYCGYLPFYSSQGITRELPRSVVPHRGNWDTFELPAVEQSWGVVNMLFGRKKVRKEGPQSLNWEEACWLISQDLKKYYE